MNAAALTQLLPGHGPIDPAGAEAQLVALYDSGSLSGHVPGVRVQANMVQSLDGAVAGADGRSGSISSPADKRVFSVLRSLADAVVVGAGTARTERYTRLSAKPAHAAQRAERGQAPVPALVILTHSGNIDTARLAAAGDSPVIVFTSTADAGALTRLRDFCGTDNVVVTPDITAHHVLRELHARGMRRILTEGGPSVLGEWVSAGAVDELCLTVSPLLQGHDPNSHAPAGILGHTLLDPAADCAPLSIIDGEGALICRYAVGSRS